MTISEEIITIANKLANEGKHPSIALVKTRLSNKVPLPAIITTLKNWQHQPERTKMESQVEEHFTETSSENTNAQLEVIIAQALSPIKQELAEIKQLLLSLNKKN